ncbi:GNAT family N-acetyltransferase [Streptomyces sp. NPDC050504]|uniref:GNAT family N-acetyltransferase n=1 Tax=Streptomyces sp. NPDC050504 TaxID=3365618 RepID=UPI00378FC067
MRIREACPEEAVRLTDLVLRSKAHWGYGEAFLESCRDELTIAPHEVTARRTVVAERDPDGVVGLATLEGTAPDGSIGMLFVEPSEIGSGVGRLLYGHVLAAAREAGFTRLTIESDPHAEGFYRAMGARRAGESAGTLRALPRYEVSIAPREGWLRAWTGERRAVHLGNAAQFQGGFAELSPAARRGSAHYASLAALASPHPAAVVLPGRVGEAWLATVGRELAWGQVELYEEVADPVAEVLRRPALESHLRGLGLPFVPWGHTAQSGRLTGYAPPKDAFRYEGKSAANELFRTLAPRCPGITVPEQWRAPTRRAAARLLSARARAGAVTVVKAEHGAGGATTRITSARRPRAVLRALPKGPLLLEEFVGTAGPLRDITFDGVVDADGTVHEVGVAEMRVRDAVYLGATVGPGSVPGELAAVARGFGVLVGGALAAAGYRGWYDVDYVVGTGGLAPTETNLRLTGPAVAFMAKARLDEVRGGEHVVRAVDRVVLGARLPERELLEHLRSVGETCAGIGATLIPTIPTASYEPEPYAGVLVAARSRAQVDAAEALLRVRSGELAEMFL